MTAFQLTDGVLTVATVNLAPWVESVDIPIEATTVGYQPINSSAMVQVGSGGPTSWSITLGFVQSFSASEVWATLWPLLGLEAALVFQPTSDAAAAANPYFTGTVLVNSLKFIEASAGQIAKAGSLTWPGTGLPVINVGA